MSQVHSGLGPAPTGYGSQYDQLFAQNPYRNLTYNKSLWQDFLSSLGFRTGYDKWQEDVQVNSGEYDAGIFSMIQQNAYNSPSAQAARERAAGLNPDLLGIGDVAPAASPTEDPNGMQPTSTDDFVSIGSQVLNLIPGIMSFATNLSQLRGIRLDNDAKELSFGSAAVDAATKLFSEGITESDYRAAFESGNWDNILDASRKDASYLASTLLGSKRAQKRFNLAYGLHANSLLGEIQKYKNFDDFAKARTELLSTRGHSYFDDDDSVMEGLMKAFLSPIDRYNQKVAEINERYANRASDLNIPEKNANLESQQLSNQITYEGSINPEFQAEAENASNKYEHQQKDIMTATDEMFKEIMDALDGDKWYHSLGKTLVGIMRGYIMSSHFSRTRTNMTTPKGPLEGMVSNFGF